MFGLAQIATDQFQGQGQAAHSLGQLAHGFRLGFARFRGQARQQLQAGVLLQFGHVQILARSGKVTGDVVVACGQQADDATAAAE